MRRYAKLWLLLLFIAAFFTGLIFSGCSREEAAPVPEPTESWAQISVTPERGGAWRQIVTDSEFRLGEKSVKGTWQVPSGEQEYYEVKYGTYPVLDGSTVAVPMAMEFARQHLGLSDEDAPGFVPFSSTDFAIEKLIYKKPGYPALIHSERTFLEEDVKPVELYIGTEPSEEQYALAQQYNVELVLEPVCYDAFVFITHKDNPVESLTVEQIRKIYSGEITNWKDIGGADAEIIPYQREEGSGSQTSMEKLVMRGVPLIPPPTAKVEVGMGMLIDRVAEYENSRRSIGYTFQFYIDTLYKSEDIKVIKIDGVPSTAENIKSGVYPFSARYYGIIRSTDQDRTAGRFLAWMLSDEGQQCIAQAGYIPLK